jgi:hypothetical protein
LELADEIDQAIYVKLQLSETGAEILPNDKKALIVAALRASTAAEGAGLREALMQCFEVLQTIRRVYIENPKAPTSPLIDITITKAETALAAPPPSCNEAGALREDTARGIQALLDADGALRGLMRDAAMALDYLADHSRPIGGQEKYNAEHLIQLAYQLRESALAICAQTQAQNDALVKALKNIIAENDRFRAAMPDDWEGDPLQDACTAARETLGSVVELLPSTDGGGT